MSIVLNLNELVAFNFKDKYKPDSERVGLVIIKESDRVVILDFFDLAEREIISRGPKTYLFDSDHNEQETFFHLINIEEAKVFIQKKLKYLRDGIDLTEAVLEEIRSDLAIYQDAIEKNFSKFANNIEL